MIEIDEATITERQDGIIQVHFKEGIEITVQLQGKLLDIYNDICVDGNRPFLFTSDEYVTITPEARDNALIMEALFPATASAVCTHSLAYRIIANFYLKVSKPKIPYQLFSKEEDAVEWLQKYLVTE